MTRARWMLTAAISFAFLFAGACANGKGAARDDEPEDESASGDSTDEGDIDALGRTSRGRQESSVSVTYEATVEDNWRRAEEEYADENYLAAQKYYGYIRSKFPYSAYAVRAELRIGDCLFQRERHLEAIDSFQNFIRLHPTHEGVPYAMFMTARSYVEQIPGDWFLIPPSNEKDQAPVRDAERSLRAYVERFPKDQRAEEGKKLLREVRERMVAHERYVANFYRNIDKPKAYLGRLEVIRANYADVALSDELLAEMIEGYAAIGEKDKAKELLAELEAKFPSSPLLKSSRARL